MCTLSFSPTPEGLIIGMNRDEQRSRVLAQPPKRHQLNEHYACLAPSETNGGMWVAAGQNSNVFALLNWYSVQPKVPGPYVSRGKIIPSLLHQCSIHQTKSALVRITEKWFHPFRLITFFPSVRRCVEWRYDGAGIMNLDHPWSRRLWASSGSNEPEAQKTRQQTWDKYWADTDSINSNELKQFHQSHTPEKGTNSVCMHREDAQTVSYTEIELTNSSCSVKYIAGAPCENGEETSVNMTFNKVS
jgi:hypothetical protein